MPGIKTRLEALSDAVRKWEKRCNVPYEDLDPLSQALVDFVRELDSLDTAEKKAEYCAANNLKVEELERMIQVFAAHGRYPAK